MARLVAMPLAACGAKAKGPDAVGNHAAGGAIDAGGAPGAVPAEVQALLDRWELCEHWAGEEPYDAARKAEIEKGEAQSCPGNEDTRTQLETKYADRPDVLAKLRALDDE
ncbi:MAG TPA: hypothetical protein VHE35_06720 [Kofleriaceae bacterium]|nr:hypothetical protein [Kofleriaceae bacterium]